MRVTIFPSWSENPYQKILSEKLRGLGVEVDLVTGKMKELVQLLKQPPDVLHIQDFSFLFKDKSLLKTWRVTLSFFIFCVRLRMKGVKLVWTVHDLINHMRNHVHMNRLANIFLSRISNAIIVHFESGKTLVLRGCLLSTDNKIKVIPRGHHIDLNLQALPKNTARAKLKIKDTSFVFLSLGIIRPYKGLIEFVQAFKKIKQENALLIIAGKVLDMDASYLTDLKKESLDDERVRIMSEYIPDDMVSVYMNASDVCVFPYLKIFNSGSIVLAMSFAKACIASDIGCFKDYLGNSPLLYDVKDKNSLTNSIHYALQNKEELKRIGDENFKRREKWTWQETAEQTLKLYKIC